MYTFDNFFLHLHDNNMGTFATVKFNIRNTPLIKIKHAELLSKIGDVPFASTFERNSPDLHMIAIDPSGTFRNAVSTIFNKQNVVIQDLGQFRVADIVHRFLKGFKKNSHKRIDREFRSMYGLQRIERNEIKTITWSQLTQEEKNKINALIKRYRR